MACLEKPILEKPSLKAPEKPKLWVRLTALGAAALLVAADQWIKVRIQWVTAPPTGSPGVLIPHVLGLQYTRNTGISFSLFGDSPAAMRAVSAITALVLLTGAVLLLSGKLRGGYLAGAVPVLAGGAGNLVDRLLHGYVVDYLELLFMRFAIFNFADVLITCGVAWLAFWVLVWEPRARKKA